jgi:hypothetical protein
MDDQAHLELVVQHAVAACAAEDLRPDLVRNVKLVSAQGLELSHPHLRHSSPAGEVAAELTYVLTYGWLWTTLRSTVRTLSSTWNSVRCLKR